MKVINEDQDNWDEKIDSVLFCYRSSKNDSTLYSPFYLVYGREPKLPIEIQLSRGSGDHKNDEISLDEKVAQLLTIRSKVHDLVHDNINKAQARQKRNYDKKHNTTKVSDSYPPKKFEATLGRIW